MTRTPQSPTSSGQDELREQIEAAYKGACTPDGFYQAHFLDKVMSLIAHHTQEAVEAATQEYQTEYEQRHIASAIRVARKDELERLYRVAHRGNFYDAEIHYRIAELSAPQQSKETSNE